MSFSIRQANAADAHRCSLIENTVFLASEAATFDQIEARIIQFPEGFLVAENEDGVVGFINTGNTHKQDISDEALKSLIGHDPTGAYVVIFSLAVLPAWQGHGIAKRLIQAMIEDAKQRRKEALLLLCKDHLVAFYERLGFENTGVSASTHGGFCWYQMHYRL